MEAVQPQPPDDLPDDAGEPPVVGAVSTAGQAQQLRAVTRRIPATDAERRALASVVRLRILRMCLYEPLTNKEIASRLGKDPATVLHHVRTLLGQDFLRAEQTRPGPRGSREVPYRATGKSWQLDFGDHALVDQGRASAATGMAENTMLRTFFEEVREVPEKSVLTSRLGLRLSVEHHEELMQRLSVVLDEFAARPQDPEGDRWSLFVAIHPEPGPADHPVPQSDPD